MKTLLFFLLVIAILATSAVLLWLLSRRWRRLWRIIARIGASILGLFSALLAVLLLFASAMCGHYDFPLVSSPDGDLNAASVKRIVALPIPSTAPFRYGKVGGPASLAQPLRFSRSGTTLG